MPNQSNNPPSNPAPASSPANWSPASWKSTPFHAPYSYDDQSALTAATSAATDWLRATPSEAGTRPVEGIFGADVFDQRAMRERLPKQTYKSLMLTIEDGERLDPNVADVVASVMKDWAG